MSDAERAMLDTLAFRLGKPNASEVFRFLVHREFKATNDAPKMRTRRAKR